MGDRIPVGHMHPNQYEALSLLKLYDRDGKPVFFVVDGSAIDSEANGHPALDMSYIYDEHSCPTNYVQCEAIMQKGDCDPHGVFDYVRSIWKPVDYDANDELRLMELFPEINQ